MSEALAVLAPKTCPHCGGGFTPREKRQITCGASRCQERRKYEAERLKPEIVEANRLRCARWYAAKTGGLGEQNAWLMAAPSFGPYLPGGGMELRIEPHPKWPIELRNTRALHAMLTELTGLEHNQVPPFAAVPWRCRSGWGIYVRDEQTARKLAGRTHDAVLFDKPVQVTTSLLFRLRTPAAPRRGHQQVRVDAITPICIRNDNSETTYTSPIAGNFISTLGRHLAPRLGLSLSTDDLRCEIVSKETQPETVPLGGKYGNVRGWTGSVVLEVNAPARWLLDCAALIGLGGRTAFGMGRISVSNASVKEDGK